INLENIKHIKIQAILATFIALIIIFSAILIYYLRDIKYQNSKNKIILNSQPNIVKERNAYDTTACKKRAKKSG
ncbi:hypothetical protein, partial [Escherichia coli]|uniref:hypothetical protein n=1 Tax=Escherichia coli TaxID=562 RepID=UPI003CE90492